MTELFKVLQIYVMPILTDSKNFIENEFSNLNFGDKRLNRRILEVAASLNSTPSLSIPAMTDGDDGQLKAIYRFFQNGKVCDQKVLQTHYLNTLQRIQSYNGKILLIADSTFVSPTKHFKGLMSRGKGKENCLRTHYCLAVTEDGKNVLGILDFNVFSDPITKRYPRLRNESDIWIFSMENCLNLIQSLPSSDKVLSRCIFIADREADEFELMLFLRENNLSFIIRSQYDRKIVFEKTESKLNEIENSAKIHGAAYVVKTRVDKEVVDVKVRRCVLRNVLITPPPAVKDRTADLIVNVVVVKEVDGQEHSIKWRLLTCESVDNTDESSATVLFYSQRWIIEEVNKAAKTGVRVEERQFTELEHFVPFLAMAFVVAWRMVALRTVTEVSPTTSIEQAFTADEVGYMKAQAKGFELPMKNVSDAIYFIGRLGGFTGRYKNPGWQILWQGWMKFYERVAGYIVAKSEFS